MINQMLFLDQNDFHLKKQCEITDVNCWRSQFENNMKCRKDDQNCWKGLMQKLPCDIMNVECWKKQYPELPCERHDVECWKNLLPQLPCRIADKECWNNLRQKGRKRDVLGIFKSRNENEEYDSSIQDSFDRYVNYGFGII